MHYISISDGNDTHVIDASVDWVDELFDTYDSYVSGNYVYSMKFGRDVPIDHPEASISGEITFTLYKEEWDSGKRCDVIVKQARLCDQKWWQERL